jgi:CheY-like chemotaxis protein
VEVAPIVRETVDLIKRTVAKTVDVELSAMDDLWDVNGDSAHLQQAIMNLAINGSHAMPEGGTLCLLASNATLDEAYNRAHSEGKTGPHVMIAVSDTGCGIDKTTQEKMYEPFFTTKGPQEGTGLGLSVVYGIVRDHGGHICCYSELGEGTTFKIYIPAIPREASRDAGETGNKAAPLISGEGRTVLLVEDEELIQRVVEKVLSRHGYRVIKAGDGQEAIEQYQADGQAFDIIIMDMNMPRMDGEHCLEELVKLGSQTPVILATGALFSAERQKKLLAHAAAIVMKPFEFDTLLSTVSEVLATP